MLRQNAMTPAEREMLDDRGYVVLPGFMRANLLDELRRRTEKIFEREGENAGSEFRIEPGSRRLANLVAKGEVFERIVCMPEVLEYIEAVLGPEFKLSSLNARSANPHSIESQQPLHADMGAVADERGYWVCNTVWMLDDFTLDNGALRVVPGSHRWRKLPQNELADPRAPHPQEVLVTGCAGDVVVVNAHMWHGGTANNTSNDRRAVHGFYCRNDKPQQQYQKALIPQAVQERFSPSLRHILALDDPMNDVLSSAVDKPSGFLK
jgi:ectoine hydroxylase-related dioxygenase (phytanoyl-CoA dioxygenase family)